MAYILNEKLGTVLEGTLAKLARYDSNTLLSSVLSLTVSFPIYSLHHTIITKLLTIVVLVILN